MDRYWQREREREREGQGILDKEVGTNERVTGREVGGPRRRRSVRHAREAALVILYIYIDIASRVSPGSLS